MFNFFDRSVEGNDPSQANTKACKFERVGGKERVFLKLQKQNEFMWCLPLVVILYIL